MKKSVTFKNANLNMAGNLYLPENMDENKKYPAIVCVHPGGGVKEQVSGLYAKRLSQNGFVTLAFDASHQGESEGEPRLLEDPTKRVEDVRCAVDYLTTLEFVDKDKIGAIGICAGGGYAINATMTERRIKAVASISGIDIGAMFRGDGVEGNVYTQIQTLENVANQRTLEANGAELMLVQYIPDTKEEADESPMVLMREAYEYYRTDRGAHKNATNRFLFRSYDKIMAFTAFDQVDKLLTQPLLAIAGSEADTRNFSEQVYNLSNGAKELFLIDGATHIAVYDVPEYVDQAVEKLNEFFSKNL